MIRVALIGFGYAGRVFHAPLIQATSGLHLTLVGSSRPDDVRAALPGVAVLPSEQALLHPDVDLVVIATPNDTHAPLARQALLAGKDVVIDKPFALDLAEAQGVAELAAQQKRLLSVFHNRRWDSDFLAVKTAIDEGLLGEVVHFESHIDRYRPQVRERWRESAVPGGGVWFDLGPHLVDQTLQLFGQPCAVSAQLARQRAGAQAVDWAHVLLDYGQRRVVLHASMLVAGGSSRFTVHGSRGSLVKHSADIQERQLLAGLLPGEAEWGVDEEPARFYDGSDGSVHELAVPRGCQQAYYEQLRDALLGKCANPVLPEQALAVMRVIEAAQQSAEQERVIVL
ncbi:oxidoreductase [Crenobacter sp. SG2303]|uniref:Oxidoreductase n=1 Tax=Crenobacter oryzisoli TaxID=3056844 RepID=A0ABT7XU34_9NEIS|nr:oxidoreductase [Crenobacter sp. SG2303]MDN0077307.1 oxidoreductase [Crenobacter sp. SG2303]